MAFLNPSKEILIYLAPKGAAPVEPASESEISHCLPFHRHVT